MKVLVIAEDPRKDAFMLLPIVRAILSHLGRPQARVQASYDPRLRGVSRAMDWMTVKEIIEENALYDVFLLCVDRDAKTGRRQALDRLETKVKEEGGAVLDRKKLITEHA